jgi:hypothetical protein
MIEKDYILQLLQNLKNRFFTERDCELTAEAQGVLVFLESYPEVHHIFKDVLSGLDTAYKLILFIHQDTNELDKYQAIKQEAYDKLIQTENALI